MALTKIPASLLDTSSGFDLQGNITLGDNEKVILGTGSDLQIYHDGSNSYVSDEGAGNLIVRGGLIALQNAGSSQNLAQFTDGGAAQLYYAGAEKLATSSTGATVTGNLAVTGDLDITGNVNSYNVTDLDVTDQTITLGAGQTEANSGGSGIIIDGSSASILWDETNDEWDFNKKIHIGGETYFDAGTRHYTYDDQANFWSLYTNTDDTFRFNYNGSGDDEIVITTSGTVGISQGSPSSTYKLDVGGPIRSSGSAPSYTLREDDASSQTWLMGSYGGTFAVRDTTVSGTAYPFQIEAATPSNTLFLDSSGKVGIGTTSPTSKISVVGGASDPGISIKSGGNAGVDPFRVTWTNGTEGSMFIIDDNGNVGISTTSPNAPLEINGGTAMSGGWGRSLLLRHNFPVMVFQSEYSTDAYGAIGYDNTTGMQFMVNSPNIDVFSSSQLPAMTILDNKNVGIGTSSPEEKLHVLGQAVFENMGNTNRGNIIMGSHGSGTSKWAALAATHYNEATGSGNGSGNAGIMVIGSESAASYNKIWIGHGPYELNPATQINFGTHSATTHNLGGTTRMVIDSSGNVGIGTSSPANLLDIMGGGYDQIRIGSNKTDNTNKTAGIVATMYTNNTVSLFQMFNQNGSNALYYGSADGAHRGINTHYFYVNTNYNATTGHSLALTINSSGLVSGDLNDTSDIGLKENIQDLESALDKVKLLKPRTFTWKGHKQAAGNSVGFVAQEVETVITDDTIVKGNDYNEETSELIGKSLNTIGLVSYLTKAIQEQQTIIDDLKARIETLEE